MSERINFVDFRAHSLVSQIGQPNAAQLVVVNLGRACEAAMLQGIDLIALRNTKILELVAELHHLLGEELRPPVSQEAPENSTESTP